MIPILDKLLSLPAPQVLMMYNSYGMNSLQSICSLCSELFKAWCVCVYYNVISFLLFLLPSVSPDFCDQLQVFCSVISAIFPLSISAITLTIKTFRYNTNLAVWHPMGRGGGAGIEEKKRLKYNIPNAPSPFLHFLLNAFLHTAFNSLMQ